MSPTWKQRAADAAVAAVPAAFALQRHQKFARGDSAPLLQRRSHWGRGPPAEGQREAHFDTAGAAAGEALERELAAATGGGGHRRLQQQMHKYMYIYSDIYTQP